MRARGALIVAVVVAALGAALLLRRPGVEPVPSEARSGLIEQARLAEARWDPNQAVALLDRARLLDPASFPELPRLVYLMSVAHEADLRAKGARILALVEEHAALGTPRVGEARVVALTAIVNEGLHGEGERPDHLVAIEAALPDFEPPTRTDAWYHLAEARLLLGDAPGAEEAMVSGSASAGHPWEELIQLQGLLFLKSRRGEALPQDRSDYLRRLERWSEPHFAWRMALADFVILDGHVWDGEPAHTPEVFGAMAERADRAGMGTQVGNVQLAATFPELFSALEQGRIDDALARVRDVLTLLARDRGCVTETTVIRPHLTATLLTLRGDLLAASGSLEEAQAAWHKAAVVEPGNPRIAERLGR